MRAVVTRVKNASVVINEQVNGQIGTGFLVLLGVGPNLSLIHISEPTRPY